jgi:peptidoglycan/LPS O-acetylase OafA/YrhL
MVVFFYLNFIDAFLCFPPLLLLMKKIHFPGLNGVRFIAALLVIVDHTELFKSYLGIPTLWENSYSAYLGAFGVSIFFVLSGFLITYLLLEEQTEGPIRVKHFYLRRILRIWPLYYLIVILGFFIVPHIDFLQVPTYSAEMGDYLGRFLLFAGLAANVAFVYFPTVAFANILWSVAVEEQFYLFWPHVVKIKQKLLGVMGLLLLLYLALKFFAGELNPKFEELVIRTRFSSMIIGGIGAYLVFTKHSLIQYIYARITQVTLLGLFVLLLLNYVDLKSIEFLQEELLSLVLCGLILNIATNPNSILKLEHPLLNYFGKISYGLYVYHLFAVVLVLKGLPTLLPIKEWSPWISYPLTLGSILLLTTGISHLSYRYFESYFLRKKARFSTVMSGDLVKEK